MQNLLPPLRGEERQKLVESIRNNGVEVPVVVDEDGNVIDGHHRMEIAKELGVDCPKKVRSGLSAAEKRILGVELNVARRQLTDAQLVRLGQQIEPDIAERARVRQKELGQTHGKDPSGKTAGRGPETRDEVAKAVGVSSGRTYDGHKKMLKELQKEPDGEQLIQRVDEGELTMADARKIAKERHPKKQASNVVEFPANNAKNVKTDSPPGKVGNQTLQTWLNAQHKIRQRLRSIRSRHGTAVGHDSDVRIFAGMLHEMAAEMEAYASDLDASVSQSGTGA